MENWYRVWRDGIAPQLSIKHLEVLRDGLITDDKSLIQGATTSPPPIQTCEDWPVEGACLVAYAFWRGDDLPDVKSVEEKFANACFECDERLGEPAGIRWLLNFWDENSKEEVRARMLAEVALALKERTLSGN